MLITQWAKDTAKLIRSREDWTFQLNKPRGNCPNCGNPYRTPKDTKVFWFWLGYMAGQTSIFHFLRRRKKIGKV